MAKIISFDNNPKSGKDNIFVSLWESFKSLNSFVRIYIVTGILIIASTPFIVGNIQTFKQHAMTPSINSVYFSYDLSFGYNVKIKLIDSDDNPVSNTEVVIYPSSLTSATDQKGEAFFTDVSSGSHLVLVKLKEGEITKEINVEGDSSIGEYTIKLNSFTPNNIPGIIYISLTVLAVLAIGIRILRRKSN